MDGSSTIGKGFFLGTDLVDVLQGKHVVLIVVTYDLRVLVGASLVEDAVASGMVYCREKHLRIPRDE
ncbi:hypothetical protein VPNG_07962 [Cytospora leucostoma]|uniref:Uncharacterized protein n=1 Tax=Cytospora leucostoma TaxID=1230097 RepID=A0A423WB04_9PEZI|nr:hypothetical protein VPNG_07962 [Cytospora leucostoma]